MKPDILTLSGMQHAQIDIEPLAIETRDAALRLARAVTTITDALDADSAADALRVVANLAKMVEATRKSVKDPILALGKRIDETAKSFSVDLITEKDRISSLLGDYQASEKRKSDEARRVAEDDARRKAYAAASAAAEADMSTSKEESERAQQAAAEAEAEAIEARIAVSNTAPAKPAGVSVRTYWKYEVTDINALFRARPDLCVIEQNSSAIRAQIPHNQSIPGLRIWIENKATA